MKAITKNKIDTHLKKARKKHPLFIEGIIQLPAIATEELGEMVKEINDAYYSSNEKIRKKLIQCAKSEALDLIAVLVRFIEGD